MLKLDRLEISGFKSFVDPVQLRFAGGITAIVGPNGCGKSNLSDAMTWVLGEQSAKSLRGDRMEDVIFDGTEARRPLGMAEVALHLRTDPSFPHAEDGRLSLSRRVFRSGDSQYRLNGRVVRLKEIRDLLMDTGLGLRAYSVIEQGKMGMILSGKPQERRRLIEEAAGITRYKERRRVAEVKLEEAMANMLRLDDILAEVERALRSLKRQAGAARRYQQQEAEHRELLGRVLAGRWARARRRLEEVDRELAAAHARDAALAAELSRDEATLAGEREHQEELAAEVAAAHQRHADLAATIEGRQQFLRASRQRLAEIGDRIARSVEMAARRREEIAHHGESLERLTARRAQMEGELAAAADEVDRDAAEIGAAEERLAAAQARLEDCRKRLLADIGEINGLRNRRHQGQIEVEKANLRRQHLAEELAAHERDLGRATEVLAGTVAKLDELGATAADRGRELAEVEATLDATLRREKEMSEGRRALADRLGEARNRRKLLVELGRAFAERRARLGEALAELGDDAADAGFLSDRLAAVAGWERSLDFYLADLAHAVLLPPSPGGAERTLAVARRLADGPGATVVAPLDAPPPQAAPAVDDPAVVLSLGEALGLSEELAAALPPAWLVERPEDAARLARAHPGCAFVSRQGVWAAGGAVHVEAGEAAPGVLERERELAGLEAEVPRLEAELAEVDALLERLVERRSALAKESNRLGGEVARLRQETAVAEARREDATSRHERLRIEGETLAAERDEVDRELARRTGVHRDLAHELAEAERRHAALEAEQDAAAGELGAAQEEREALREASAGRRGRLELLTERLEAHDREMGRLRAESEEGDRQVREWSEERARLDGGRRELAGEIEAAEAELAAALEQRSATGDAVVAAQERLDAHRGGLRELETRIHGVRERREAARAEVEELRVRQAGLEHDAEHVAATWREEFAEADGAAATPPPAADPPERLAELEAELARTRATLERLGPVNVLAVDEYAEQEERHAFLTTQRADVAASVESLRRTIREINQTSSERFRETFTAVNASFAQLFARLFRGGEAEMRLLDEEDVLESGIEIVARPPGKRLQNIQLMSGGEKALTAIALLFALFHTKPSPFCILDEVDAPLDDLNTMRFAEMLREMAPDTQFIVITHNKLTMESAATLYGVTMEEKGVSKLVSVELEETAPTRATA